MRVKDDSVKTHFHPYLTGFLFKVSEWYDTVGSRLVITSGSEHTVRHGYTSLHYAIPSCAVDTRTWEFEFEDTIYTAQKQQEVMLAIKNEYCAELGIPTDWIEVILEGDHMHSEFQPKRPEELA